MIKSNETIIKVENLTKKYDNFISVDNISFEISKGDIFGFLGHNGAGKTTTITMLTTLLKPSSGSIKIGNLNTEDDSMIIRKKIGYLPENIELYSNLTAYENLEFFAKLSGVKDTKKAILETLEFLNATIYANKKISQLSKGMRQRIGLAQAIIHNPEILFLDEPTSGLDPQGIKQLRDIIIKLNKERNMTIFMNTHLLSEVAKTCKTIGVLNHGKLVYLDSLSNTLKKFKDEASLEEIYFNIEK